MTVLGALARSAPQAAIQSTPWGDWSGSSGQTWAGVNVDTTAALQLLTVYGCDRFICDGISTFPTDVLRRDASGAPVTLTTPEIIRTPADGLEFIPWATQFLSSLLLAGNFYGFRVYGGSRLREVIPLDPAVVTVRRDRGRKVFDVNGRTYSTFEIMHVPGVMLAGSETGLAPIEAARQMIGAGLAAEEFTGRFWGEGAAQGGVIEVPAEKTPDEARAMARAWDKTHGGSSQAHKTGVLVGGASWKQTQISNEQAQFLETRQFTASQIASMMFQIDPSEMGLPVEGSSLTYANLEQRNLRKVQVTFLPWIIRLEAALTSMLPRPQYVKLNVNALLRGDTKSRFEAYGIGIDKRFMVPNEARDFEDWAPLEGGDEFPSPPALAAPTAPGG